jgi:uncharacterized protein (DUF2267 family)
VDYDLLVERVSRWAGIRRKRDARRAIAATTRALRECLLGEEARLLEPELAPELVRIFRDASHTGSKTTGAFFQRVGSLEGVTEAFAIEHAQATCQAFASLMSAEGVERLTKALPQLAALFVVPDREPPPPDPHPTGVPNFAEGRPGGLDGDAPHAPQPPQTLRLDASPALDERRALREEATASTPGANCRSVQAANHFAAGREHQVRNAT